MIALLDITEHSCETRNVEIYIVNFNYKQMYFQKLQVYGQESKELESKSKQFNDIEQVSW